MAVTGTAATSPIRQARETPVRHERLATGLAAATGGRYTAVTLPFNSFAFTNNDQAITFTVDTTAYTCSLAEYSCTRASAAAGAGRGGRGGGAGVAAADLPSPDGKRIAYINKQSLDPDAGQRHLRAYPPSRWFGRDQYTGSTELGAKLTTSMPIECGRVPEHGALVGVVTARPVSRNTSRDFLRQRATCSTCRSQRSSTSSPEERTSTTRCFRIRSVSMGSSGGATRDFTLEYMNVDPALPRERR